MCRPLHGPDPRLHRSGAPLCECMAHTCACMAYTYACTAHTFAWMAHTYTCMAHTCTCMAHIHLHGAHIHLHSSQVRLHDSGTPAWPHMYLHDSPASTWLMQFSACMALTCTCMAQARLHDPPCASAWYTLAHAWGSRSSAWQDTHPQGCASRTQPKGRAPSMCRFVARAPCALAFAHMACAHAKTVLAHGLNRPQYKIEQNTCWASTGQNTCPCGPGSWHHSHGALSGHVHLKSNLLSENPSLMQHAVYWRRPATCKHASMLHGQAPTAGVHPVHPLCSTFTRRPSSAPRTKSWKLRQPASQLLLPLLAALPQPLLRRGAMRRPQMQRPQVLMWAGWPCMLALLPALCP